MDILIRRWARAVGGVPYAGTAATELAELAGVSRGSASGSQRRGW